MKPNFQSKAQPIKQVIPISEFKKGNGRMSHRYYSNYYQIPKNEATRGYWRNMYEYQTPKGNLNCSYVFLAN